MVAFPSIALSSAQNGVTLWASSVLPAQLPFFICVNFMISLSVPQLVGKLFERPFQALFGTPGCSAFVFLISITSGYPMGAKLIGDLRRQGEITQTEAKRMLAFCSTSGPLFMLGTVGVSMLASPAAGMVVALSHYLGAVANGILLRMVTREREGVRAKVSKASMSHRNPGEGSVFHSELLDLFTDSILSSFRTLGIICGYIVLFTLITDFIQFSGILNLFTQDWQKGIFKGILEMTVGCSGVAQSGALSLSMKCVFCTFLVSFGGFSIAAQSVSMLAGADVSFWYYLRMKLTHGLLAAVIAALLGPRLLGAPTMDTWAGGAAAWTAVTPQSASAGLGAAYGLLFSTKMVIMIAILLGTICGIQGIYQRGEARRREKRERKKRREEQLERGRDHSGI